MKIPVKSGVHVDLNTAAEDQLDREIGLGPERARRIIEGRPFFSWDEVTRIEGMTKAVVDKLAHSGVELGDPEAADVQRSGIATEREETGRRDVAGDVPSEGRRSSDVRHT